MDILKLINILNLTLVMYKYCEKKRNSIFSIF